MKMILIKEEAISERMAKQGFNKIGLSKEAKLSQTYINQVLNSKRHVSAPVAKKIYTTLHCEFDDIFYYKEPEIK